VLWLRMVAEREAGSGWCFTVERTQLFLCSRCSLLDQYFADTNIDIGMERLVDVGNNQCRRTQTGCDTKSKKGNNYCKGDAFREEIGEGSVVVLKGEGAGWFVYITRLLGLPCLPSPFQPFHQNIVLISIYLTRFHHYLPGLCMMAEDQILRCSELEHTFCEVMTDFL